MMKLDDKAMDAASGAMHKAGLRWLQATLPSRPVGWADIPDEILAVAAITAYLAALPPNPRIAELEAQNAKLRRVLERCEIVLGNMAMENEGAIFNRWPISHEPLRADARGLLPVIAAALASIKDEANG